MSEANSVKMTITESAQVFLKDLLAKQDSAGIGIRVFVENPGTPRAECCMAYCTKGEEQADDVRIDYPDFPAFIDGKSVSYLEDAVIDYNKDRFGGQLTFKAPKSKLPNLGPDASLEERINYILLNDINPSLASHGGNVSLIELYDDKEIGMTAVLKFGGGCQGCASVELTLKQGVEARLMEQLPELKRVTDNTDHSVRDNAYYK
jgi:Fe/S biogenesis protein NfuA